MRVVSLRRLFRMFAVFCVVPLTCARRDGYEFCILCCVSASAYGFQPCFRSVATLGDVCQDGAIQRAGNIE